MTAFHAITLSNGLRIIHEPSPTDIVYCGLFVDAGTKDEDTDDAGLAHFCEHTSFKGTTHRKAYHIRNRLESVGGDLNAYTNKEETVYYATIQKVYFDRAADLLFDIVFHSTFPQQELEKLAMNYIKQLAATMIHPLNSSMMNLKKWFSADTGWEGIFWEMRND